MRLAKSGKGAEGIVRVPVITSACQSSGRQSVFPIITDGGQNKVHGRIDGGRQVIVARYLNTILPQILPSYLMLGQ